MKNAFLLRFLLVIFSPLIFISLLYFLFLSKPELFSGSFERYKYQDYSFSFKNIVTNKNPLYPELIFEDVVLKNKNEDIKIINHSGGAPFVELDFDYKGDVKVSISHTQTHAVAFAILQINS